MPRQTATSHPAPANLDALLTVAVALDPNHTIGAYHVLLMMDQGRYFALSDTMAAVERLRMQGAFVVMGDAQGMNAGARLVPLFAQGTM